MPLIGRRSLIVAALALPFAARQAYAQRLGCSGGLRVAYLVPITGPYAITGSRIIDGARAAANEAANANCPIDIVTFDTEGSVARLFELTVRAVEVDGANLVVAPFGSVIVMKLADRLDSALFIDLIQSSPSTDAWLPDNYVSILFSDFVMKDLSNREEAHFNQGKASLEIIAAVARSGPNNISDFIEILKSAPIHTPSGTFNFNQDSHAIGRM